MVNSVQCTVTLVEFKLCREHWKWSSEKVIRAQRSHTHTKKIPKLNLEIMKDVDKESETDAETNLDLYSLYRFVI